MWKLAAVLAAGLIVCLMLAACGEENPPPPEPEVVRKKIAEHTGGPLEAPPKTGATTATAAVAAAPGPAPLSPTGAVPAVAAAGAAPLSPAGGVSGPLAMAGDAPGAGQAPVSREYNPLGKANPFEPPIQETTTKDSKTPEKKIGPPPGPLEQYDLAQLSLVGIIQMQGRSAMALVQVPSGRGYVVKEGTRIGNRSGKVIRIDRDAVVVEELVEDFLKNVKKSIHELKLQKSAGAGEG